MNHGAITAVNVSKMYKLHGSGALRFLEFLGFGGGERVCSAEDFWALRDVSFSVEKGTTLGIVGRNGAGKSTLLKLLAGASMPTDGKITIQGRAAAMLDLGTGFHPDLTGHENIFACGLYLGLTRTEMEQLYDEIVSFAELGAFLHQPVRTYSAGMQMRLAFSVATAQAADIQVIDEVLGVGDAYFFGKCLERFKQFQKNGRTTVLVSHDNATLLRLCTRCIWLDKGRIVKDGSPLEVIMAYTEAIQSEQDRKQARRSDLKTDASFGLRTERSIEIRQVVFLNEREETTHAFTLGESLTIRMFYDAQVAMPRAIVSVTIFRSDGVTVCNAISSMDGVYVDLQEGEGIIDLQLAPLQLGPGEYMVSIGIYAALDLNDSVSPQHAVMWHRQQTFCVRQPIGVALDLGIVRHQVTWVVHERDAEERNISGEASRRAYVAVRSTPKAAS